MAKTITVKEKEDAVIYRGDDEEIFGKAVQVMEEYGIPKQFILPLNNNLEECGGVEATGEIWLKQKGGVKHLFKNVNAHVCYDAEISCVLEKKKMKKVKGVKARKRMLPFYVPVLEVYVDDADPPYIHFVTHGGLKESHPLHLFIADSDISDTYS